MANPIEAPSVERVLKHNKRAWVRHFAARLVFGLCLIASSFALHIVGVSDSFLTALPVPLGCFVLLFLIFRTRHGRRLAACERVLRIYPLEYRTRVEKKSGQWLLLGTVFTLKVSTRGQHGAPLMRAINASTVRRWPTGAENGGAWVAGDLVFGGVMIVPSTHDMLFMQPADWQKFADARESADPSRVVRAERAGLTKLVEKEPNITYAY
ncbi:hypothetical protein AB0G32_17185 [Streptomyces sp. NPDC023723]|uniref:hypothetical protein n=1 Tax=Streptomyces sp. NPDC023723 TaxID=3154323 RepID=UPI0033EC88FC